MHAPSKASCIALHKDVRIQAARPIGLWTTSVVSSIRDEEGLEEAVLLGGGLSDSFVRACVRAFVHALVEDSLTFTSMMLTRSVRSFCSMCLLHLCQCLQHMGRTIGFKWIVGLVQVKVQGPVKY